VRVAAARRSRGYTARFSVSPRAHARMPCTVSCSRRRRGRLHQRIGARARRAARCDGVGGDHRPQFLRCGRAGRGGAALRARPATRAFGRPRVRRGGELVRARSRLGVTGTMLAVGRRAGKRPPRAVARRRDRPGRRGFATPAAASCGLETSSARCSSVTRDGSARQRRPHRSRARVGEATGRWCRRTRSTCARASRSVLPRWKPRSAGRRGVAVLGSRSTSTPLDRGRIGARVLRRA